MQLNVSSTNAAYSTPIQIVVKECDPGASVSLELEFTDEAGVKWKSRAEFVADHGGAVDILTAPSMGGSFRGVDPDGLWWSLFPDGHASQQEFQRSATHPSHKMGEPVGDVSAPRTHILTATQDDGKSCRCEIQRYWVDRELVETLDSEGLKGFVISQHDQPTSKGVIMVVTGSDGGVDLRSACALASLGYDVLALAHFGYPGRPDTLAYIEIEYFEQAITYACERFGVERVAVQGRSRGGDLALLLGSIFPERIAGVTCLVGYSHVIAGWMDGPEGWTIAPYTHGGRTVPYLKLAPPAIEPSVVEMTDDGVVWSGMPEYGRAQPAAEAAEIAVERADCPILLISGGVDAVWDCASASIRVVNRLRVAGYPHRYRHLLVEDMGHRVPFPQSITTMAYGAQHPLVDLFIKSGGRPEATARAAWPVWNELVEHYEACFQNKAPSGN